MKREEKNVLSRQRILTAAITEFAENGYDAASLNNVCAKNGISKGIIYHYYRDKDELYLLCVKKCFEELTVYLADAAKSLSGTPEQSLGAYFDARLRFFNENRIYAGVFASAAFAPPAHLAGEIASLRSGFDELNIAVLTAQLSGEPLRAGLSVGTVVDDFAMYMDYFNLRFNAALTENEPADKILREHDERCRRQLNMLLYGIIGEKDDK